MKKYYASVDELGIDKGQQVWPWEEAMKMANEDDKDTISRHPHTKFWGIYNGECGGFLSVLSINTPICVEAEGENGK